MKKTFPSFESKKIINRTEVIEAYKKFFAQGVTNPDDLDLDDPEVKNANSLFDQWQAQEDARANGSAELQHRAKLAKTMLYVDAGFTDPGYLDEVLHEFLAQDAQDAEKQKDNPERTKTRQQIADAMKKIRGLLQKSQ